jgi:hypothetical protein
MNPNARAEVLKLKGAKTGKFVEADLDDYNEKLELLIEYFETVDEGIKAKEQTDKINAKKSQKNKTEPPAKLVKDNKSPPHTPQPLKKRRGRRFDNPGDEDEDSEERNQER